MGRGSEWTFSPQRYMDDKMAYMKSWVTNHGNARQSHSEIITSHLLGWLLPESDDKYFWGCCALLGLQIGIATMTNIMEGPPESKNKTSIWLSNPISGHLSKEEKKKIPTWKDTPTLMSLFTTAKDWGQHRCPSGNGWIKKMWGMYVYGVLVNHKQRMKSYLQQSGWTLRALCPVKSQAERDKCH